MKRVLNFVFGAAAMTAASVVSTAPASAQSWPTQRVTVVVPFGAGSVTDILARIFAEEMGTALGPAGHRREPARARRHRRRRQGHARRLHPDGHVQRPHRRGAGDEGRAVRSGEGFRRHHPARLGAAVPDHAPGRAGQDGEGGHRARQEGAGQAQLLLAGPRQHDVHRRRAVPPKSPASTSSMCRSAARPTR